MKIAALSNWQMDSQKVCMWGMISYPHDPYLSSFSNQFIAYVMHSNTRNSIQA